MLRGALLFGLVLVIESFGNTVKGDQCSSRNNLDTNERDCQQLVDNNNKAAKRPFTLECQISRKRQSFYKCHKEWCKCLGVFLNQSKNWWFHFICIWKFNHYGHFRITHRGKGRPLLTIDVKLCNYSRKYELFTIKINEHESGLGNIKNDSSPDTDDGFEEEDDLLTKMMRSVQQRDSLQGAVELFDARIQQYLSESFHSGTNITQQEKMRDVFVASTAFEQFLVEFAQNHLNHTTPQIQFNSTHVDLQLRRNFYQNESEFLLQQTKQQNYVKIPAGNIHNGTVVLGVIYKDLHQIFLTNQSDIQNKNETRHLNTIIMSATIAPRPEILKENVTLAFENLEAATLKRDCVFLSMLENRLVGWSEQGCHVKSINDAQTECSCNHMTHFAVLMQFDTEVGTSISEADRKALEILTYLGLTLSLIGITLTIIGYVFLTDMKGPLSQIRVSLVASLGAGQIIFLVGIGATKNKGTCVTVAAFVQYFLMAAFCWMLVEGIYLYLFVVKVYNVSNKLKICHGVSWGFPALVVALSLSIAAGKNGVESFVSDEYCWISSANNLIWIFIVFVVVIELLNILILVRVVKEMTKMQQAKDSKTEQIRLGLKACVLLLPLLGLTWLFGLLSPFHKALAYIFTIFNTTQGFLIFLLHCVRNTEIRSRLKRKIRVIFPAINDGPSLKRSSRINDSTSGNASLKKIEVKPSGGNNKLGEGIGGNASLKKTEIKPSNMKSKLTEGTKANTTLKKIDFRPSGGNSKLAERPGGNVSLKKTDVKPSNRNSRSNHSTSGNVSLKNTGVKPPNKNNRLNNGTRADASLKKTGAKPSNYNSTSNGGGRSLKT